MNLMTQNSVMNLLIGKAISRTANVQILDSTNATTYIAAGEIVVTDVDGTVLDSTTVLGKNKIKLVQGQGATLPLIWSDEIFIRGVKEYKGKAYTAPTVQIDYVGFDSVTNLGSIDVISDNDYEVHVFDIDSTTYGTLGNSKYGFYTSDSSATQQEIAINLTESLFTNTRDLVFPALLIEMVTDLATYAAATSTHTLVNGSDHVVAAGANTVVAGDLIRVTTNTDLIAVYYVDVKGTTAFPGATANDFRINYPYQGTSIAGATLYRNTVAPTQYGIRVTGKDPVYTAPNLTNYHVNRFKTTIMNAGSTPVVTEQNATEGSGVYAQVALTEYFLLGNEGLNMRQGVIPQISPRANAEATGTYGMIYLYHFGQTSGQIMTSPTNYKQLMLAFNQLGGANTNYTGVVTSVQTVLNAWLGSSSLLPAFTAVSI